MKKLQAESRGHHVPYRRHPGHEKVRCRTYLQEG